MGFLLPLYLAGLAALSAPFLLHLVRRTPRGRQVFSSLMFLSPATPRLTRRSRIEHWLLLILRLAALALIALAFARPFLRETSLLALSDLPGRRLAILIDTSASMRRDGLWNQALDRAQQELDDLNPQDDIALYAFDHNVRSLVDFAQPETPAIENKPDIVRSQLQRLEPGWGGSDLGLALTTVASELDAVSDQDQSLLEPQILVISDLQAGARIDALQATEWPQRVTVIPHHLRPASTTNAGLQILPPAIEGDVLEVRVRITNAADSRRDQFAVGWKSELAAGNQEPSVGKQRSALMPVYVPAGESRDVRLKREPGTANAEQIVLEGDDHGFDNIAYTVPPAPQQVTVVYVGQDSPDDVQGLQYFFRLAADGDVLRQVTIEHRTAEQLAQAPLPDDAKLILVSQVLPADAAAKLSAYVTGGGQLVLVPASEEAAQQVPTYVPAVTVSKLPELPTDQLPTDQAPTDSQSFQLLGEIDFQHPLFAPFAVSKYSDFTRIHFWRHHAMQVAENSPVSVIARFDNGNPALLDVRQGTGRIVILASGWQPRESQFALSSKFVPFVGALLDLASGPTATSASFTVGESLRSELLSAQSSVTLERPDGTTVNVAESDMKTGILDRPGIYRVASGTRPFAFDVNLVSSESETAPLMVEQLEQFGVRLKSNQDRNQRIDRLRQQRDVELESTQKIWRWLLAAAIVLLITETCLASRADRLARPLAS